MRVRDLLGKKPSTVVAVEPRTELSAAVRLFFDHNIGGLAVVAPGGRPVGFLAERDVVRAVDLHQGTVKSLRVDEVMRPVPMCSADDVLEEVMRRMTRQRLRHLVAVDGEKLLGVVSVGDIVKHRLEQLETETGVLRDYVAAQRATR
jgi:CBS domain-containing protein